MFWTSGKRRVIVDIMFLIGVVGLILGVNNKANQERDGAISRIEKKVESVEKTIINAITEGEAGQVEAFCFLLEPLDRLAEQLDLKPVTDPEFRAVCERLRSEG